jgi:hypothetical protein
MPRALSTQPFVRGLFRRPLPPNAAIVATAPAAGHYSPIPFSLARLVDPCAARFWLPRLVCPPSWFFSGLGFVMLGSLGQRLGRLQPALKPFLGAFTGYMLAACRLFIGFLA